VSDVHPKTLSLCIVVDHDAKKPSIPTLFRDMLEKIMIMECGTRVTPLHLKIVAWHAERKRHRYKLPFESDDLKRVLC
jgi:hypothetical protein